MFMRFVGGGIGHKSTDYIQQDTPICVHDEAVDEVNDEDIMPINTQGHTQAEENVDADGDQDEVDAEEEADYGYADCLDSEGGDSEGEDSEDEVENDDEDEPEYDVL